jgi:hypothetical protein
MIFEKYGFNTEAVLPGLNLSVKLGKNKYLRNDGLVNDIDEHTDLIKKELKVDFEYEKGTSDYGGLVALKEGKEKAAIIFFSDPNPKTQNFYSGHESGHAIIYLGLEKLLIAQLRQEGFTLDPFKKYNDEELIAHTIGLFSLYLKNKDINLLNYYNFSCFSSDTLPFLLENLIKSKK